MEPVLSSLAADEAVLSDVADLFDVGNAGETVSVADDGLPVTAPAASGGGGVLAPLVWGEYRWDGSDNTGTSSNTGLDAASPAPR